MRRAEGQPGDISSQVSLQAFCGDRSAPDQESSSPENTKLPPDITLHNDLSALVQRGDHASTPTDLVIAPVDLHRRTIKHRFTAASRPRDTITLTRPIRVAKRLFESELGNTPPPIVDRVDRVRLLENLLEEDGEGRERFRRVLGPDPAAAAKLVDQARTELETMTGYHPQRLSAIREYCNQHDGVATRDLRDLVEGTVAIEKRLRIVTDRAPSKATLLRQACQIVHERVTDVWSEAYPAIDRLWICGLSTLSASLVDLLATVRSETDVDVHLQLRRASAPVLRRRLPALLSVDKPGTEVFDTL